MPPLLLQDVGSTLVAGDQVGTVLRSDERLERMDAGEKADEIVLAAEREHRVDEVVADAGFALLDFEAIDQEQPRPHHPAQLTLGAEPRSHINSRFPFDCRGLMARFDRVSSNGNLFEVYR